MSVLEVSLATRIGGDFGGIGATICTLLMDRKLPTIVVVSKRAACVLKIDVSRNFPNIDLILRHIFYVSSEFIDGIDFYKAFFIVYHRVIRSVCKTFLHKEILA